MKGLRMGQAFLAALLCAGLLAPMAQAQQPDAISTGTINLQQVLEIVRRDNPEILASRKRWEAAQKRIVVAATPDKPRLDIERMYAPSMSKVIGKPDEKSVSITQEIPFPTVLYLRHGLAAKDAAMLEQAYRAKLLEVSARARTAYAMLFLAGKGISIYDESIGIMRRFSRVAESKVSVGRGTQSDALKAQVELTRMLNMRVTLEQEQETSQAMLNALMGREARAALGMPQEPASAVLAMKADDLESSALSARPELREAALASERSDGVLSLARSEYLPDLMLQHRQRSDLMRGQTHDAVLGLTLPLWFWRPAAMVQEAKAERDRARAELNVARLSTQADVHIAWSRVRTAQRLLDACRTTLLPQAEESLKVAESGYQSDKIGFLDLLDAQRSLLNFKLEYYQYMAEYEARLAELERIVGREL
ncbi:MAG: TolC family protein [Elusimicrobia bacterium]|nr:TolC family protein [Elusimicrobiota bacterium]